MPCNILSQTITLYKPKRNDFVLGLSEDDLVKCSLVMEVLNLRHVYLTPVSAKDWEIAVSSCD